MKTNQKLEVVAVQKTPYIKYEVRDQFGFYVSGPFFTYDDATSAMNNFTASELRASIQKQDGRCVRCGHTFRECYDMYACDEFIRKSQSFPSLSQSTEDERRARLRATEPMSNTVNRETQQWLMARLARIHAEEGQ